MLAPRLGNFELLLYGLFKERLRCFLCGGHDVVRYTVILDVEKSSVLRSFLD